MLFTAPMKRQRVTAPFLCQTMHLILVIFLAVNSQVSGFNNLYAELENLGGSCFPRDSCATPRPENEDNLWGNYTCECGAHCVRYGTCCADSPYVGKTAQTEQRGESCKKFSALFAEPVVVVSRCSDRWQSNSYLIRKKCEEKSNSTEDPLSVVPVTNLATLVTYKNYFCALCNYATQNIFLWDIALQFRIKESGVPSLSNVTEDYLLDNLFYDKERQSWVVNVDEFTHNIKLQFKIPPRIRKFVKKCHPNIIMQCDQSYSYNRELQYKCLSYYAPIKLQPEKNLPPQKYRNIHCAICNSVNVPQVDITCKLDVNGRRQKPAFSFAHLLDINRSDGDLVGKKEVCGDPNQKWDPFFKKCRSLTCAVPGYVIRGGKCVQS